MIWEEFRHFVRFELPTKRRELNYIVIYAYLFMINSFVYIFDMLKRTLLLENAKKIIKRINKLLRIDEFNKVIVILIAITSEPINEFRHVN